MANTVVKEIAIKQVFPDVKNLTDSTVSYFQGDIMIFDTTTKLVRAATAESECVTLLGIADANIYLGKPFSPYYNTPVDAAQAVPAINGPIYGMTAKLILKSGDSLTAGAAVFAYQNNSDTVYGKQYCQAAGTKAIGVYQGPAITGDGVAKVEVLIGSRYPNDTLKF
jgi:hypothetical protein